MATINQAATLFALSCLLDQYNERSHLTLLFNGVQGIGKSEAVYLASEKLNGDKAEYNCATIDGNTLSDGEITGIPFRKKSGDVSVNTEDFINSYLKLSNDVKNKLGDKISSEEFISMVGAITKTLLEANISQNEELDYAKYPVLATIERLQKFYYQQAKSTGFKLPSGLYKIEDNGDEVLITNEGTLLIKAFDELEQTAEENKNKYAFGDRLSPEDRIYLLLSGQVRPFFTLVDELNRPEQRTMSEMMNLVLNRKMNGYKIPWWVCLAAAQNPAGYDSEYATVALEAAQLDRFCFINVSADAEEWAELSFKKDLPEEFISAVVSSGEKAFSPDDLKNRSMPDIKPSPRSNTIVGKLLKNFDKVIAQNCFSEEDRREKESYKMMLLNGLLGIDAANALMISLEDSANLVTIKDILTGVSNKISHDVVLKIKSKSTISQKVLVLSLISWLCKNWCSIKQYKTSANPEELVLYTNYNSQLAELVGLLHPSIMNYFCESITSKFYDVTLADGSVKPQTNILKYVYEIVNINPEIFNTYQNIKRAVLE